MKEKCSICGNELDPEKDNLEKSKKVFGEQKISTFCKSCFEKYVVGAYK